ncbi:hypothetical protein HGRIS_003415 [Hohenbuehelia grisea]|uniref:MFS general substrate transporter n=1 Tax=Hohenbuehelia grisea TaxID=104357 RepID=A0ABR3JFE0_9AGAR
MQPTYRSDEQEQPLLPEPRAAPRRSASESSTWRARVAHGRARWKAHPYWLIPVVVIFSMCRGLTLAPRIQVYNNIACQAIMNTPPTPPSPSFNATLLLGAAVRADPPLDCTAPEIQGRAAKIQATIITTMSILSAITTGLWSRFGDLNGRKIILCTTVLGAIVMDIVVLLVIDTDSVFSRHGEQLIVLGPVLDGLTGGLSAFNGVVHAYISDCTVHGSRSKIFSTVQGLVFVGLSVGPWVGSLAMRLPSPSIDSTTYMFYLSIFFQCMILAFIGLLLPESLPAKSADAHDRQSSPRSPSDQHHKPAVGVYTREYALRFLKTFMSPITIFRPRNIGRRHRDWNLTLLGSTLFIYLLSIGVYQVKYLYAKHIYAWTAEQLGFYMSLLWTTRAINLLLLLPIIISYTKPKAPPHPALSSEAEPPRDIPAELQFDQRIARYSLFVDGLADFLVVLSPISSQGLFVVLSCLNSFTSGGNPALHSLGAVCLHSVGCGDEVGTLFGAMGVLSAIAHTISPPLYALTYGMTVESFPKTIFCLATGFLATVVTLLGFIRPGNGVQRERYSRVPSQDQEDMEEEDVEGAS